MGKEVGLWINGSGEEPLGVMVGELGGGSGEDSVVLLESGLEWKHGALRPQKPLRLIRDGEVGEKETWALRPQKPLRLIRDGEVGGEETWGFTFTETIKAYYCLLYTSPSPRDRGISRMPSSA